MLSTPAGFISPEFLFGAASAATAVAAAAAAAADLSVTFHGLTERGRGSFRFNDRPWSFGPTTPGSPRRLLLLLLDEVGGTATSCSFCRDLRELSFRFTFRGYLISV
jgi:hypothetical protein